MPRFAPRSLNEIEDLSTKAEGGCWIFPYKGPMFLRLGPDSDESPAKDHPKESAHRLAFLFAHQLPADALQGTGLQVRRHCRTQHCCNPAHLWLSTAAGEEVDISDIPENSARQPEESAAEAQKRLDERLDDVRETDRREFQNAEQSASEAVDARWRVMEARERFAETQSRLMEEVQVDLDRARRAVKEARDEGDDAARTEAESVLEEILDSAKQLIAERNRAEEALRLAESEAERAEAAVIAARLKEICNAIRATRGERHWCVFCGDTASRTYRLPQKWECSSGWLVVDKTRSCSNCARLVRNTFVEDLPGLRAHIASEIRHKYEAVLSQKNPWEPEEILEETEGNLRAHLANEYNKWSSLLRRLAVLHLLSTPRSGELICDRSLDEIEVAKRLLGS